MKKKGMSVVLVLTLALTLGGTLTSYASEWKKDDVGWWYDYGYGNYAASTWMEIDGKDYYFNTDGYMLHDTVQDGFVLGSDGARVINDIGLAKAPYKDYLDTVCQNYPHTDDFGYGIINSSGDWEEKTVWTNCGDYYSVADVSLVAFYMDDYGANSVKLGSFDEIYIRKDGKYTYDNKIMDLNQWQDSADGLPRFGLRFDEKGYVVSFWDANVM